MNDYLPFFAKNFQTGVVITGLGKAAPYALQFKKRQLVASFFLSYEMDDTNSIDDVIAVTRKSLTIGKDKIFFDSRNLVDPLRTILNQRLTLIK